MDGKQVECLSIIIAVLILGIVIIVHEFGHFLLAKTNGIVVEEFSVGMGPRILSTQRGTTRYSLKLIPFGGSCMMKGEDGEDEGEGTFNSKSVWRRFSVIAAGPIFNFILAFFGAMIIIGIIGYDPPVVTQVKEGTPEEAAGLKEGDLITSFDGKKIYLARDLYSYLTLEGLEDKDITVTVKRDGKKETLTYHPTTEDRYMLGFSYNPDENQAQIQSVTIGGALADAGLQAGDYISAVDGNEVASGEALSQYFEDHPLLDQTVTLTYLRDGLDYDVEVTPQAVNYVEQGFSYNLGREKTSALGVIKYSVLEVRYWINSTLEGFKLLITGKLGMDSLSGPVGVVNVIGDAYQEGALMTWLTMINMMILISANLGVANLLPLPALDGGRLVFLIIEAIRRKPIDREKEGMVHAAGMFLLLALMVFIMFNDVRKLL